jgi:2'-5' RNA ligase
VNSKEDKRLFFALWPDDEVIQNIQEHVIKHFLNCQGRILDNNNWHITLAYFGSADANTQACLEEQAKKIKCQPFELNLSKCGFWPRPKVAWLAPEEIPEVLKQLTNDLQQAIIPCGFKLDTRDYQPHITLVRKAKHQQAVSEVDPINWQVTRFCLVESKTYPEGAQYKVLKSWDL